MAFFEQKLRGNFIAVGTGEIVFPLDFDPKWFAVEFFDRVKLYDVACDLKDGDRVEAGIVDFNPYQKALRISWDVKGVRKIGWEVHSRY